jgi:hypothetical protein
MARIGAPLHGDMCAIAIEQQSLLVIQEVFFSMAIFSWFFMPLRPGSGDMHLFLAGSLAIHPDLSTQFQRKPRGVTRDPANNHADVAGFQYYEFTNLVCLP